MRDQAIDERAATGNARRLADLLSAHTTVHWKEVAAADHRTIHDWNLTWKYVRAALNLPQ